MSFTNLLFCHAIVCGHQVIGLEVGNKVFFEILVVGFEWFDVGILTILMTRHCGTEHDEILVLSVLVHEAKEVGQVRAIQIQIMNMSTHVCNQQRSALVVLSKATNPWHTKLGMSTIEVTIANAKMQVFIVVVVQQVVACVDEFKVLRVGALNLATPL